MQLYVDGVLVASNLTSVGRLYVTSGPLWLGYSQNQYFDGVLDDVRYYTRALSPDQSPAFMISTLTPTPMG